MRRHYVLAIALSAATALPAAAQDHPTFQPKRDVAVTYHVVGVTPGQHRSDTVRMYFTDSGMKVRIEPVGQPGFSIVDRASHRMTLVLVPQHAYVEMAYDPKRLMTFDETGATFSRTGAATVAGIGCTLYQTDRNGQRGEVCISGDGVLLRARSEDPSEPSHGLEATSVVYAPQPASLFAPPPGFQQMDMANMVHGMPGH